MPVLAGFLREAKTRYLQLRCARRVVLNEKRAIVSFTFDDVPRSAFTNGLPIMDEAGIKATFYVAMALSIREGDANSNTDGDAYLNTDDILSLHEQGHHIACHTFSHYRLEDGSVDGLITDARRNVALLEELLGKKPVRHFSYPFGQVNFELKCRLSPAYDTLRSSRPGINLGISDLNLLRATSIYNPTFSRTSMLGVIEKAARSGGWLIFYTHGVDDTPDDYSCTPEQLAWVIWQCASRDMLILPISSAHAAISEGLAAR
ncbi:MAG TPA: polysaccharide deacetylase family protein [Gammaproteobacteria bacterium]|nr:polysaccharide deacetylase family protein [Gammaproteobacteria bacterium]